MPDAEALRAAVRRYQQAMTAGDEDAYVGCFASDATLEDPVGSPIRRGHDEIRMFFAEVRALSPSISLVPTGPVCVAGNEVAFAMLAVSDVAGRPYAVEIIDVFSYDEAGLIVGMKAYWDPADMRAL